jgi:hypothetical protein
MTESVAEILGLAAVIPGGVMLALFFVFYGQLIGHLRDAQRPRWIERGQPALWGGGSRGSLLRLMDWVSKRRSYGAERSYNYFGEALPTCVFRNDYCGSVDCWDHRSRQRGVSPIARYISRKLPVTGDRSGSYPVGETPFTVGTAE